MARKTPCNKCGSDRDVTITATVKKASSQMSIGYKRMCIPCLLQILGVPWAKIKKLDPYREWIKLAHEEGR